MEVGDGSIKTFALRGVKDNPPYLHDQRLLTLDDTVEFFNLVLGDKLTARLPTTLLLWVCERSRTSAFGLSTRSPSASDKHTGKPASQGLARDRAADTLAAGTPAAKPKESVAIVRIESVAD